MAEIRVQAESVRGVDLDLDCDAPCDERLAAGESAVTVQVDSPDLSGP